MPVDLRSDTVTRPTPEMYAAMQTALLGDDVLQDDPTIQELERVAAEMSGKEAAMFVSSGTQSNQIAIAVHCERGSSIIAEEESHILYYEGGGPAVIAGVVSWTVPSQRGTMDPEAIEKRILTEDIHRPATSLICVENTHNRHGGAIVPTAALWAYREISDRNGVKLHLDGARAFNAAVALGVPIADITAPFDTVSLCLSKGLRSPVGSVLCGPADFMEKARKWRKRLGGGMRQAGILAACGLVSLRQMVDRLAEDHANAKLLATGLQGLNGLSTNLAQVETNMVMVETVEPAADWQARLHAAGVWCFPVAKNRLRLVTHADVSAADIQNAIDVFSELSSQTAR